MQPSDIKALLKRFVSYVTDPGDKSDEELLKICDGVIFAYHAVDYSFDNSDYPDAPSEKDAYYREKITELFPDYGYYCLTASELEHFGSETMIGDAIDDLGDLARDFEEVLWCFEHTSIDDALWHFHNGYWMHWGRHMRDFQLYLFRRITGT